MMEPDSAGDTGATAQSGELRALLGVLRGLRTVAEGRLAGLAIAPGEYLADIYCIQRVATLLAMELAAAGRSLRRSETREGEAEVHAIEEILARALERLRLTPDMCVLDLAEATVVRRDGDRL